ncbi:GntR family transcriptional regulator [Gordonia sp. SL306]|uniref:GntR family transcriptional regulator n=1 Tax=Gordonia sp. SL306 TaxID=2995145 RepID=UPI00226F62C0|nr:GntR family transcriptional regulator [Gordonia sp. SL306]WAC57124.1 GntR family transcriptional regulator [Gordonia sp. SL306]
MADQPGALLGLQRTNLREQAVAALRTAITRGELRPRSALIETELSERLGISRGTLREALRQLQQEGLVVPGPRGRLSVRSLERHEVRDIFAVRAALEALAAADLAALPDRAAAVAELRETLDRMQRAGTENLDDRIEADLDFHRALCRLTGNDTLVHSWTSLEGSIRMSIMYAGTQRAVGNMDVDRHAVIIDAIDSGNAGDARDAIVEHMNWAADNLVNSFA